MGQLVVAAAGAYVGEATGLGAALGWSIGSMLGASLGPKQRRTGPRIDDLKVTGTEYGQMIPFVQGAVFVPGQIIWASSKYEVPNEVVVGGKGGPQTVSTDFTYKIDVLYLISSGLSVGVRRILRDGKLVYTRHVNASPDSIIATIQGGYGNWDRISIYTGGASQLPDPIYEAAVGTGNAPAHRGMTTVFIQGMNLGTNGVMPQMQFEISTGGLTADPPVFEQFTAGIAGFTLSSTGAPIVQPQHVFTPVATPYGPGLHVGIPYGAGITTCAYFAAKTESPSFAIGLQYGSVKFMIPQLEPGSRLGEAADASSSSTLTGGEGSAFITFLNGASTVVGEFFPRNFSAGDTFKTPTTEPTLSVQGGPRSPICPFPLPHGEWYEWIWTRNLVSPFTITRHIIKRASDGVVISDMTRNDGFANLFADRIRIGCGQQLTLKSHHTIFTDLCWCGRGLSTTAPTVVAVIQQTIQRAGLSNSQIVTTGLTGNVTGMAITQVTPASTILGMLACAYLFESFPRGNQIVFRRRGQASAKTLAFADLGAGHGDRESEDPFRLRLPNDEEIPGAVHIRYMNADAECQVDVQYSDRRSEYKTPQLVEIPLVMTPLEAKRLADSIVEDIYYGMFQSEVSVLRDHAEIEPTDILTITDEGGKLHRMRVVERTDEDQLLKFKLVGDNLTMVTQNTATNASTPVIDLDHPIRTTLDIMDLPILRDSDDSLPGFYIAVSSAAPGWHGANVFRSIDAQNYEQVDTVTTPAVVGFTTPMFDQFLNPTKLNSWVGGNMLDPVNVVEVTVNGVLTSASRDDVLDNLELNALLIGTEVVKFVTATLLSSTGSMNNYRLSGLVRGVRGTERAMANHGNSERVVLLSSASTSGMRRLPADGSYVDATRYMKVVSLGHKFGEAPYSPYTLTDLGKKCYFPVNVRAVRHSPSTNDWTLTWDRRTRLTKSFTNGSTPLGETSEAYEVEFYTSNYGAVRRVLQSIAETVTYTAAQQTTDFGSVQSNIAAFVYQMGTYGRGYFASKVQ